MASPTKNSSQQEIYNNKEAAALLRVSTVTLYRERKKGKINFRRVGAGKVCYTREDLDNYLEQQKRVLNPNYSKN